MEARVGLKLLQHPASLMLASRINLTHCCHQIAFKQLFHLHFPANHNKNQEWVRKSTQAGPRHHLQDCLLLLNASRCLKPAETPTVWPCHNCYNITAFSPDCLTHSISISCSPLPCNRSRRFLMPHRLSELTLFWRFSPLMRRTVITVMRKTSSTCRTNMMTSRAEESVGSQKHHH